MLFNVLHFNVGNTVLVSFLTVTIVFIHTFYIVQEKYKILLHILNQIETLATVLKLSVLEYCEKKIIKFLKSMKNKVYFNINHEK